MNWCEGKTAAGLLVLLALSQPVESLPAQAIKIGVVDQQTVFEKTNVGKRALGMIKEFSASRQRLVSADDEELKKLEAELKDQSSKFSDAARREKQDLFRSKLEAYQRRLQEFNREIQLKQQELTEEFQKKLDEVTQVVAEKHGFSAIVEKGNPTTMEVVIYHHGSIDLTEEVVKEFDRRHK